MSRFDRLAHHRVGPVGRHQDVSSPQAASGVPRPSHHYNEYYERTCPVSEGDLQDAIVTLDVGEINLWKNLAICPDNGEVILRYSGNVA